MASLTKVKINNIDTSIEYFADPLVLLNYGSTLANTDVGFIFNRDGGISPNVAVYWNETTDKVTIAYTSTDGLPNSNIALTKYANVAADWYFGNLAGGTTNTVWVSANVLPTANAFYNFGSPTQRWNVGYFAATTLDLGGSQISVDPTNGFKFTVGGTGTPTYLASNGLISGTTLSSSGTITAAGAINTSANILASQVSAGSVVTTGGVNAGGNVLATVGIFNSLNVNGNITVGAITIPGAGHSLVGNIQQSGAGTVYFNTPGNIMAGVGQFGQVRSDGFINTTGNISTAQLNAGQINTTGNVLATSGVFNALTVNGNETITGFLNVTGNILSAGAIHNSLTVNGNESITGYLNVSGNVLASTGIFASGSFGAINSSGFINTTANISAAQLNAGQINTTGNVIATSGVFNSLTVNGNETVTGYLNVSGNVLTARLDAGAISATGIVYANATTATTSTATGALRVAGGLGVTGNTVIAGILTAGSATGVDVSNFTDTAGAFYGSANSWVQLGIQNASTAVGASTDFIAYANNGDNDTGWIDMGITGQNYVNQNGQFAITGPNDGYVFMSAPTGTTGGGNLVIATGNTGIHNDVIIATGGFDTIHEQARFIDGVGLKLIQGTASINPSTGALIVQGGVGIGGNLNVQGDISLNGNLILTGNAITFNTNNLSISDSLIYLADGNAADVLDIGFIGAFTNPGYQHTGFVRDATDGTWKIFANVVAEPVTTVDFTDATYGNLKIGNLSAVSAGFDGNVTAAYHIGTIGTAAQPVITSLGTLTSLTSSGLVNTSGNILAASATFNSLTVNGNELVTGYLNVTGNILSKIGTFNEIDLNGYLNATGNILATTGIFNGLTVNGGITSTGFINTTANLSAAQVNSGIAVATNQTYTGELFVTTSSGDEGGQLNLAPAVTNNTLSGNIIIDVFQNRLRIFEGSGTNRGGYFDLSTLSAGVGTNLAAGGGGTPGGGPNQIQFNQASTFAGAASLYYYGANGAVVSNAGISSTSTTTGSFQISGGVGISENINVGGYVKVAGAINTSANILASQVSAGSVVTTGVGNFGGNILSTGAIHNSLQVNGNITVGAITIPGTGHSIVGNIIQSGAGTIYFNTSGNIVAAIGSFGTLIVGSTTIVTNLNADLWDGNHFADYLNQAVKTTSSPTFAGVNSTGNVIATGAVVNALTINGTTNTQTVQPLASNTYTLGSTTAWYSKAFTKSAIAQYADLAENYTSDSDYAPGTVLVFGGEFEVTQSTQSHDTAIAGVVSTNPAYHMNALTQGVAVALQGRVPCQVLGPVRKGDRVVASDIPGVAERLDMIKYQPGCIIGKALENINDNSIQTIEVVVGRL